MGSTEADGDHGTRLTEPRPDGEAGPRLIIARCQPPGGPHATHGAWSRRAEPAQSRVVCGAGEMGSHTGTEPVRGSREPSPAEAAGPEHVTVSSLVPTERLRAESCRRGHPHMRSPPGGQR